MSVFSSPHEDESDVDREIRIERMKRELEELSGGSDTDHLSDRELYTWLWTDGLHEETPDLSRLGGAWHTIPIGSCTDQDTAIFLKYYASKKERPRWKKDFPNDLLPPRCPLPHDRDRTLPRPE